jgi:phage major head subunit gpT-like protein
MSAGPQPTGINLFFSTVSLIIGQVWAQLDVQSTYKLLATTVPSDSEQEVYVWQGMLPKPRIWNGPRVVVEPSLQTYTLVNLPWEGPTLAIDKFKLADDKYGVYYRMLPDQARQVRRWPDYCRRDMLENRGNFATPAAQSGLDALTFFNTAHLIDFYGPNSGTYSNDFTGGGIAVAGGVPGGTGANITVGGAFSPTAFATLVEYMMRMLGEDLEPLGVMPDKLEVPVTLKTEAELVIKSTSFAPPAWATITSQVGAADNVFARWGVDIVVNPLLTSGTKWYLHQTQNVAVRGTIWQEREAPVYTPRTSDADPVVFDLHKYLHGVYGRAVPGWGPSFLTCRSGP